MVCGGVWWCVVVCGGVWCCVVCGVWCVVWCGMVWCGMVRCGAVRCVVWCGVWCGVVWCGGGGGCIMCVSLHTHERLQTNSGGHVPVDMNPHGPVPVHRAPKTTPSAWSPVVAKRRARRTQDDCLSTSWTRDLAPQIPWRSRCDTVKLDKAEVDHTLQCHPRNRHHSRHGRNRDREGIARSPVRKEVHAKTYEDGVNCSIVVDPVTGRSLLKA